MSFHTWSYTGIGFDVAEANNDAIFNFLKNHEQSIAEYLRDDIMAVVNDEEPDFGELLEVNDTCTISSIIADIMSAETGIGFDYIGIGDDDEDAVMFLPCFPWEYSDKERALTREEIVKTMTSYAQELCLRVDTDLTVEISG